MNRSLAVARVAALLLTCLAACGGDDAINGPTSSDSGPDGTTPVEASLDDASAADGTVAESSTGADGNIADTGADGNIADTGADGSLTEAGVDGGLADAHADGAATDAGLDAAVEAGPACAVNNTAPAITETVSDAAAAPVQTGGTLVSGTYFLTSFNYVGGGAGCVVTSIKWTLVVTATNATTGNLAEISESPVAAATVPGCANQVPYATGGANLLAPDGGPSPTTYTASSTQLTLVTADNGACGTAVTVFTKQP
jgi:hypothetical protein